MLREVLPKSCSLSGVVPGQLHDPSHDRRGYEAVVESGDCQHGGDVCHTSSFCTYLIEERR